MLRGEAAPALLLLAICTLQGAQAYAPPHISFTIPPDGPDSGGYDVFIVGRNLGFLDDDVKVFVAGQRVQPAHVQVPWERIRIRMPKCPKCGVAPITVRVGSEVSEPHNFTMTNRCIGPVTPPDKQVLPSEFSGHENCTVCVELVHLTQALLPDQGTYQALKDAMHGCCETVHFKKYTVPGSGCSTDLVPACKNLVQSMGEAILDGMWALWRPHYFRGELPNSVCQVIKRCDKNANY